MKLINSIIINGYRESFHPRSKLAGNSTEISYKRTEFKDVSIKNKRKVHRAYVCDLDSLATLKFQIIAVLKPWEEERINLVKKQAKKVKISPKEKKGYGEFTKMLT